MKEKRRLLKHQLSKSVYTCLKPLLFYVVCMYNSFKIQITHLNSNDEKKGSTSLSITVAIMLYLLSLSLSLSTVISLY